MVVTTRTMPVRTIAHPVTTGSPVVATRGLHEKREATPTQRPRFAMVNAGLGGAGPPRRLQGSAS